jgi:hypothetical protein
VPRLCKLYPVICLTTEEKAGETLSQGSRKVPVGILKTECTERSVHNNKQNNKTNNSLYKGLNIVDNIKIRRLGWAGHIIRMEEEKIPKKGS